MSGGPEASVFPPPAPAASAAPSRIDLILDFPVCRDPRHHGIGSGGAHLVVWLYSNPVEQPVQLRVQLCPLLSGKRIPAFLV